MSETSGTGNHEPNQAAQPPVAFVASPQPWPFASAVVNDLARRGYAWLFGCGILVFVVIHLIDVQHLNFAYAANFTLMGSALWFWTRVHRLGTSTLDEFSPDHLDDIFRLTRSGGANLVEEQRQRSIEHITESFVFYANVLIIFGMVCTSLFVATFLGGDQRKLLQVAPEAFVFTATALVYSLLFSALTRHLREVIFDFVPDRLALVRRELGPENRLDPADRAMVEVLAKVLDDKVVFNLDRLTTQLSGVVTTSAQSLTMMNEAVIGLAKGFGELQGAFQKITEESRKYLEKSNTLLTKLEKAIRDIEGLNENEIKVLVKYTADYQRQLAQSMPEVAQQALATILPPIQEHFNRLFAELSQKMQDTQRTIISNATLTVNKEILRMMPELNTMSDYITEIDQGMRSLGQVLLDSAQQWPGYAGRLGEGLEPLTKAFQELVDLLQATSSNAMPMHRQLTETLRNVHRTIGELQTAFTDARQDAAALGKIRSLVGADGAFGRL